MATRAHIYREPARIDAVSLAAWSGGLSFVCAFWAAVYVLLS
jgi:hypothetical protein